MIEYHGHALAAGRDGTPRPTSSAPRIGRGRRPSRVADSPPISMFRIARAAASRTRAGRETVTDPVLPPGGPTRPPVFFSLPHSPHWFIFLPGNFSEIFQVPSAGRAHALRCLRPAMYRFPDLAHRRGPARRGQIYAPSNSGGGGRSIAVRSYRGVKRRGPQRTMPRSSVENAMALLGYPEISAFTHACKRWTGMTPSQCSGYRPRDRRRDFPSTGIRCPSLSAAVQRRFQPCSAATNLPNQTTKIVGAMPCQSRRSHRSEEAPGSSGNCTAFKRAAN